MNGKVKIVNNKKEVIDSINIAFPILNRPLDLISKKVYESTLFQHLSYFVNCSKIPIESIINGYSSEPRFDYIYVNLDTWRTLLFIMREQRKIQTPFIVYLHLVYLRLLDITQIIPLLRAEDIIIVPSEYAKKCFLRISDKFNVIVMPYTLDVEKIQNHCSDVGKGKKSKTLTYLGRIVPEKGLAELICCMPEIIRKIPCASLEVIGPVSGNSTSEEKSKYVLELEKRVHDLKMEDYINWRGSIISWEKYRVLSQADVFVNPSFFKGETFGIVNVEALACGIPVVCSRWSAHDEIVSHAQNGFLIDVKRDGNSGYSLDQRQLAAFLVKMLGDQSLLDRMKIRAKKTAFNYHFKNVMPRFVKHFKKNTRGITGQWAKIKSAKISDFRHLYREEWFAILCHFGVDNLVYANVIDGLPADISQEINLVLIELIKFFQSRNHILTLSNRTASNIIDLNKYLLTSTEQALSGKEADMLFKYISGIGYLSG